MKITGANFRTVVRIGCQGYIKGTLLLKHQWLFEYPLTGVFILPTLQTCLDGTFCHCHCYIYMRLYTGCNNIDCLTYTVKIIQSEINIWSTLLCLHALNRLINHKMWCCWQTPWLTLINDRIVEQWILVINLCNIDYLVRNRLIDGFFMQFRHALIRLLDFCKRVTEWYDAIKRSRVVQ